MCFREENAEMASLGLIFYLDGRTMSVGTLVFFYNYLRGRKSEYLRIEIYLQPQEELGGREEGP